MAAGLLAALLYCEKNELQAAKLAIKTILSCLFILTVVIQSRPVSTYFLLLLIGMLFCLGGDVFLALPHSRMFLWGLVSFLVGHVFYVIAFGRTAGTNQWTLIGLTMSLIACGAVYLWLRPHLGNMKIAVICYMVVISAMAVGAWSMLGADHLRLSGRVLACGGALSFYVSDVFVARQRFVKSEFFNRLIGLPLYYGGQFMLAFSVGLIG
ncbi:MAG: lysoplasmalogenase [Deltaproteobacteria bacterium]|nr:lysoplasmalogenase [Deltaproteobacteria bacterium]